LNPLHSLPYINDFFHDNDVTSPGIGNMSPDHPRSAVPTTRQIEKIVLTMIVTSVWIVIFTNSEIEDMV
jgi:hypothetical protein